MHIGIEQRNYKEECSMCGTILYPMERFIATVDGEAEIRMCLLCARKTARIIPKEYGKNNVGLSNGIEILLEEIREMNKSDDK